MGAYESLERLCKWRKFFAGWQLGTRADSDGESRALRHHLELSMVVRAELSALMEAMIAKGVLTEDELDEHIEREADKLSEAYANAYPGFRATDDGLAISMPAAQVTMKTLGFPP